MGTDLVNDNPFAGLLDPLEEAGSDTDIRHAEVACKVCSTQDGRDDSIGNSHSWEGGGKRR